ncbi:MAG: hypothetical protein IPK79_00095 [Vampirovibrionales bacterium]|nr:hypothetical protein [Vampirovibrionales bacterium]
MAVLNYTTTIDPHKSVGEIQKLLAGKGARGVLVGYDDAGNPVSLAFEIAASGAIFRYQLPCRHHAVWKQLQRDPRTTKAQRTEAQALRVAWRILKDWVEAQMAIVEAQMVDLREVFFAYSLTDTGQTMYERSAGLLTGPAEGNG